MLGPSPGIDMLRNGIKSLFRHFGFSILRLKNNPKETLVGLKGRSVCTVIDCGANEGQFARYISSVFPNAVLHCFEPLDEPFQLLSSWAASKGDKIHCYYHALGDEEGEATMHHHINHSASSSLLQVTKHEVELFPETEEQLEVNVPVTTLDAILNDVVGREQGEILLKLDVQGYEDRVLRGATKLLEKVDICLLEVCVDPLYTAQADFKDLVVLLDQRGFRYAGNMEQSYGEDGRVMWLDALFLKI
jgi:FkbM family methyltransferase